MKSSRLREIIRFTDKAKRVWDWVKTVRVTKRTAICCAAAVVVSAAVLVLISAGDGEIADDCGSLVTRFPMGSDCILGDGNETGEIFLSWQEKTIDLNDEGDTYDKLDAVLYPITLADRGLTFTSSDPQCLEIDGEGNITAKNPGSAEITVTNPYTGASAKAYVSLIQPVSGFYIKNSSIDLYITDTSVRVEPVVYPSNATNTEVTWYSKDTSIVEVDQTGHLKPVARGMAEVVGTTADGGYTAKCFVNVINEVVKVADVSIINGDVTVAKGESVHLMASVSPANARNKLLTWTSGNRAVAEVSSVGVVKGVGSGTTQITAVSADGVSATVTVTVEKGVESESGNVTQGGVTYVAYDMSLAEMAAKQMPTTPKYSDGNGLKSADETRVAMYLDPNEFSQGAYKYQFMDLSHYSGISRERLAQFLNGKGVLSGKADVFIEAAKRYNVSELYLVAHACLETGYGTSNLATGIEYNGTRVYNMFGIGAYDSNADLTGAKMAYSQGWTTPEAAIDGGAKWISENYVNAKSRQNTLYKMRWNPDKPGEHLYAGDVAWAVSQAIIMSDIAEHFADASIAYEVPVYAGSTAARVDADTGLTLQSR